MKIDFANLQHQYQLYKKEIDAKIQSVLNRSNYIMGEEVQQLEKELQDFTSCRHAITCSSGSDALLLAMMTLDIRPGDEIITTPFTFIATAEMITFMKAIPVFVDIDAETFNIDASKIETKITDKTKAIIPVSLYGQPADMKEINDIAKNNHLKVIIDGAQCLGATYQQQCLAQYCDIYTTSFFPAKPLGGCPKIGNITTNVDMHS
jgi:UDP-2-acetamido-2-deoxy-ribo-hexuluronate aminotransferase